MGLSASQAKLLSITARLSDNELRSQTITGAKMALANQTTEASRNYINALNKTSLTYSTYDLNGNKTSVALTGSTLSSYAPLKNQYALINANNQILVSEADALNYKNSENLTEFLEKYGVEKIDTGETKTITNPNYQAAYDEWKVKYDECYATKPDFNDPIYREITDTYDQDNALYTLFKKASEKCFNSAIGGSSGCYQHVLAHMIDLDLVFDSSSNQYVANSSSYPITKYKTTTGQSVSINASDINGSYIQSDNMSADMLPVSDAIRDGYNGQTIYAAENSLDTLTESSTEDEKLLSNYYYDENGEKTLKTLQQKCIDLFYAVNHYTTLGLDYTNDLIPAINRFQDDMSLIFPQGNHKFLAEDYENDVNQWLNSGADIVLTEPATLEEPIYKYSDDEKAQWYINLWHRMNGESENKDGTITNSTIDTIEQNGEYVVNKTDTTTQRWDILEDGLMNSKEWLQYALESGTVTLERVDFSNPTENGTGLDEVTWTSIIYTNAADISEQTDETAIAKAEAEYTQKQKEIEAKDKQFDNMIKLLDTEHTALETEYDSVKSVMTKNIDRTLKIYQA